MKAKEQNYNFVFSKNLMFISSLGFEQSQLHRTDNIYRFFPRKEIRKLKIQAKTFSQAW